MTERTIRLPESLLRLCEAQAAREGIPPEQHIVNLLYERLLMQRLGQVQKSEENRPLDLYDSPMLY
jgi:hypothetical protein